MSVTKAKPFQHLCALNGDSQHVVQASHICGTCSGFGFFFFAIAGIFVRHFMHMNNFSFSQLFHWTRLIRSKNCHGSTEVSGVNPARGKLTHQYGSELKSNGKKENRLPLSDPCGPGWRYHTHLLQLLCPLHRCHAFADAGSPGFLET